MCEGLLIPVLMYRSEMMVWKVKEKSRIKSVQMDNLRYLLGIGGIDRIPIVQARGLCGVMKNVDNLSFPVVWPY